MKLWIGIIGAIVFFVGGYFVAPFIKSKYIGFLDNLRGKEMLRIRTFYMKEIENLTVQLRKERELHDATIRHMDYVTKDNKRMVEEYYGMGVQKIDYNSRYGIK